MFSDINDNGTSSYQEGVVAKDPLIDTSTGQDVVEEMEINDAFPVESLTTRTTAMFIL